MLEGILIKGIRQNSTKIVGTALKKWMRFNCCERGCKNGPSEETKTRLKSGTKIYQIMIHLAKDEEVT